MRVEERLRERLDAGGWAPPRHWTSPSLVAEEKIPEAGAVPYFFRAFGSESFAKAAAAASKPSYFHLRRTARESRCGTAADGNLFEPVEIRLLAAAELQ